VFQTLPCKLKAYLLKYKNDKTIPERERREIPDEVSRRRDTWFASGWKNNPRKNY